MDGYGKLKKKNDIIRITGKTRENPKYRQVHKNFKESTGVMTFIKRHATMLYLLGKEIRDIK